MVRQIEQVLPSSYVISNSNSPVMAITGIVLQKERQVRFIWILVGSYYSAASSPFKYLIQIFTYKHTSINKMVKVSNFESERLRP